MRSIKVTALSLGLIVLSTLAFVGVANASSFKAGDLITVGAKETIDSMLFTAGSNINIAGNVNGDVYCAGQTITISGSVNGDVICAGQTIVISGNVEGNIRLAGQTVTLSGMVGGNATIGSQDLVINNKAIIGHDLLGGSQNITVNGTVGRDIVAGAKTLVVNGQVGRNINGDINDITVGSIGQIIGNVDYISKSSLNINDGGKIAGTVTRTEPKVDETSYTTTVSSAIGWFIYALISMLTLALVLVVLFPNILHEASTETTKKPGQTALIGLTAFIVTPAIIVILLISTIGIPVAALAILSWLTIMLLVNPFVGYLIGRLILPRSKKPIWPTLVGTSLLVITYSIPFVGFLAVIAANIFGAGMVLNQTKRLLVRHSTKKS